MKKYIIGALCGIFALLALLYFAGGNDVPFVKEVNAASVEIKKDEVRAVETSFMQNDEPSYKELGKFPKVHEAKEEIDYSTTVSVPAKKEVTHRSEKRRKAVPATTLKFDMATAREQSEKQKFAAEANQRIEKEQVLLREAEKALKEKDISKVNELAQKMEKNRGKDLHFRAATLKEQADFPEINPVTGEKIKKRN